MSFIPTHDGGLCSTSWNTDGDTETWADVYLSVNSVCTFGRTIVHEIVHGLAGYHTHKRFDRDAHVEIKWENISPDQVEQFEICEGCCCETWGYPYDCNSVMHYAKD